jgi:predicted cupin superfamily sugar epimerase
MYHHYLGDPLEVLLLYSDGRGAIALVGPDWAAGMRPHPAFREEISAFAGLE